MSENIFKKSKIQDIEIIIMHMIQKKASNTHILKEQSDLIDYFFKIKIIVCLVQQRVKDILY